MPTTKRSGNKQPADDPALKRAVKKEAKKEVKIERSIEVPEPVREAKLIEPPIVSINSNLDPDELHLRDSRS